MRGRTHKNTHGYRKQTIFEYVSKNIRCDDDDVWGSPLYICKMKWNEKDQECILYSCLVFKRDQQQPYMPNACMKIKRINECA